MNSNKLAFRNNRIFTFYACFFFVLLIAHFCLPLNWADDAVFYEKTLRLSLSEFLSGSARPLVDTFTYFFTKYPILWRIINPFVLTVLSALLSTYLPQSKNEYAKNVAISLALIYPSMVVVDAGFVATTLNYLWPVTMGMLCLLPIWRKLTNRKITCAEKILLIPCLLYAINMQQMAIILVVIFGMASLCFSVKKKFSLCVLLQFLISVACSVYSYVINTVGDNPRMLREIDRYFPDFDALTFLEKVELGFSSTFYCMTMEHSFAWFGFFAFLCVLVFAVYKKSKNVLNRVIVLLPPVFSVLGIAQSFYPEKMSFIGNYITGELENHGLNKAVYSFEPVFDVFIVITILCILYSMFILIENRKVYIASCFIFFLGLGSRMLMGFSPTVWASGYRTFYIMFVSLIVISYIVIGGNTKRN